jgi:glycosyltransferase involved in cell wall biosynthesis
VNIAILTNFQDFNPGYSLTGIVKDQIAMLRKYGHNIYLFMCENYNPKDIPSGAKFLPVIPFAHLTDYQTIQLLSPEHKETIRLTKDRLLFEFKKYNIEIVFTHDWIFTGWNIPHGQACIPVSQELPNTRWMHWIHSVPSGLRDWWQIKAYGGHHKIVFPNETDRLRVAEQFRGEINDVRVIHHIKDMRTWHAMDDETCRFIDKYPAVMEADVVQILPASCDRLSAKRVDVVIKIMAGIKRMRKSVCLVIANQWATSRQNKESIEQYKDLAKHYGVHPEYELIFTSDFDSKYEVGIPQRMIRDFFLLSNLFIFPTREESFGLVCPESAMSGVLQVSNASLDMQREINGGHGLYFDFGSHQRSHTIPSENYYNDIAYIIVGRMRDDDSIKSKTFARQRYNMDFLYNHEYLPTMMESRLWD